MPKGRKKKPARKKPITRKTVIDHKSNVIDHKSMKSNENTAISGNVIRYPAQSVTSPNVIDHKTPVTDHIDPSIVIELEILIGDMHDEVGHAPIAFRHWVRAWAERSKTDGFPNISDKALSRALSDAGCIKSYLDERSSGRKQSIAFEVPPDEEVTP